MPPFCMKDFKNRDIVEKLQVVIMGEMAKPPLTMFRSLTKGDQRRFNDRLNFYIRSLPEEWEDVLQRDFNRVCQEDLFTEKFKAESNVAGCLVGSDIIELRD